MKRSSPFGKVGESFVSEWCMSYLVRYSGLNTEAEWRAEPFGERGVKLQSDLPNFINAYMSNFLLV